MSPKKPRHFKFPGDSGSRLSKNDLIIILRAADDLNGRGGIELLAEILKGMSSPRLRKLGLQNCPVFGIFAQMDFEHIQEHITQAVNAGYLTESDTAHKSGLLLTAKGWSIERQTLIAELLNDMDTMLSEGPPFEVSDYSAQDRETMLLLLDEIEASGETKYIPILEAWQPFEARKMRTKIDQVIKQLQEGS